MPQKTIIQMLEEMGKKSTSHVREPLTTTDKQKVLYRQKGKCKRYKICKVIFYKNRVRIHFDHIKPVKAGGKKGKDLSNIQALCPNCHDWKTHMEDKHKGKPKQTTNPILIFKQPKFKMPKF